MINLRNAFIAIVLITSFGCARSVAVIDYQQPDFKNTPAIIDIEWRCGGIHHDSYCGSKTFGTFKKKHYVFPKGEYFWGSGVAGLLIWPRITVIHPYSYWVNTAYHYEDKKMKLVQIDVEEIKKGVLENGVLKSSGYKALSHINTYIDIADSAKIEISQPDVIEFANEVNNAYTQFSVTNPDNVNPELLELALDIIKKINSKKNN